MAIDIAATGSTARTGRNDIGKYKFLKTIQKGSFATVQLAKHTPTGEMVAIKVTDKSQISDSKLRGVYKEAHIMKSLSHPHIAKVFQIIDTEDTFYVVMEHASGGDLFQHLAQTGRIQEKEVKEKFRQIVSAVRYCHQKNIVHRDLKPENILLDSKNNIKITDFDLSEEFVPGAQLDTYCGTLEYFPPEFFKGKKFHGPEAEVWSLGVLLYELLTDCCPFGESDWAIVSQRVRRGKCYLPDYLSTDCKDLISMMLSVDPKQRPSIDIVNNHKWLQMGVEQEQKPKISDISLEAIDSSRIEILYEMGFSKAEVEESLTNSEFDECYACYLLLGRKEQHMSSILIRTTYRSLSCP